LKKKKNLFLMIGPPTVPPNSWKWMTGVGVFAPQYGPRRGFYGGLAWRF